MLKLLLEFAKIVCLVCAKEQRLHLAGRLYAATAACREAKEKVRVQGIPGRIMVDYILQILAV